MNMWWYLVGESRKGPYSLQRLEQLLREEEITAETLVWRDGLAEWVPVRSVAELADVTPPAPPAPPPPMAQQTLMSLPAAGPWRRLLARFIDLFVLGYIMTPLLAFALASWSLKFAIWMAHPSSSAGFALISIPAAMFGEWLTFAIFGNTLGKALLGIVVTSTDAKRVTASQYFSRQIGVYWYGLGLGLPIVSLFTMWRQRKNLKNQGRTSYDSNRFNVKARPIGIVRNAFAILIFVTLTGLSLILGMVDKQLGRQYYIEHRWHNPVTGKALAIPSGWTHDIQKNTDGQRVDVFTAPIHGALVLIGKEDVAPSLSLNGYRLLWLEAVVSDMTFNPSLDWVEIEGRDAIIMFGHITGTPQQALKATLVKTGSQVWRVILMFDHGKPIPHPVKTLERQLLSSIG